MRVAIGLLLGLLGQATAAGPPSLGQADEALTRRFTPLSVAHGTYVVYRSERRVERYRGRAEGAGPGPIAGRLEAGTPGRARRIRQRQPC